ncbi:hypothetical protein ASG17_13150 [Brevundimonas sp. Leaf363]|uniref:DUF3883 domain-containing protein n=1 Tax=Brevundimonas sp. Leaf363 TaxID=1736353 RepID=UPI000713B59E|nr:DUF3883 domain-containing protein [Brevundimonas sp. Leaf363]KQS53901.1 hypothetical protein ASG17_13150 [Brevundimonas sp. Leaf363]
MAARAGFEPSPSPKHHRNRALGLLGEEHVFHHERARLIAADRSDLARKIEWTSQERGDGAGYDIRSFDPSGAERLIEVKATRGGPTTPFYLTRTEREVSQERPEMVGVSTASTTSRPRRGCSCCRRRWRRRLRWKRRRGGRGFGG